MDRHTGIAIIGTLAVAYVMYRLTWGGPSFRVIDSGSFMIGAYGKYEIREYTDRTFGYWVLTRGGTRSGRNFSSADDAIDAASSAFSLAHHGH